MLASFIDLRRFVDSAFFVSISLLFSLGLGVAHEHHVSKLDQIQSKEKQHKAQSKGKQHNTQSKITGKIYDERLIHVVTMPAANNIFPPDASSFRCLLLAHAL